jgi:hypothetical protein
MREADLIPIICTLFFGGDVEPRIPVTIHAAQNHVVPDCVTATSAIEIGLDRRSSLDSLQQALFAAEKTGKAPMIVLVDSDGEEGVYEYRIETAARRAGVAYVVIDLELLRRWQMTAPFRAAREQILSGGGRDGPSAPAGG